MTELRAVDDRRGSGRKVTGDGKWEENDWREPGDRGATGYLPEKPPEHAGRDDALERVRQLVHRLEPLGGIDGQAAQDDGLQLGRQLGPQVPQLDRRAAEPGDHRLLRRLARRTAAGR